MGSTDEVHDRQEHDQQAGSADAAEAEEIEAVWKPPERSDQAPGEETVQVNDTHTGGQPLPAEESHADDDQHPTGG